MQMDRQRQYREISDPYNFSPNDFYHRYRFYKEDIPYLVNKFCLGLEPNTRRSRPVPVDHKLLTLKYLASNSFQNSVGDGQVVKNEAKNLLTSVRLMKIMSSRMVVDTPLPV